MIITIANESGGVSKTMLANSLATMRTMTGRSVLLLDNDPQHPSVGWNYEREMRGKHPLISARSMTGKGMQPELENLTYRYQDIVIDTESRDSMGSRSALTAAHVAVIVIDLDQLDQLKEEKMLARIATARLLNPRLRTLVVMTSAERAPSPEKITIAKEFVSKIPAASLFHSAIHSGSTLRKAFHNGLSISEVRPADLEAIDEMQELCHEVFDFGHT